MRPLTDAIPKALIPADGRPFVDHQLGWLAGHGVTDVVLCIGYRGDAIRAHLDGDGAARHGLRVRFVDEGERPARHRGRAAAGAGRGRARGIVPGDVRRLVPADRLRGGVSRLHAAAGKPALMTVFRNDGRWDTSNVIFDGRMVTLYDKQRTTRPAADFTFIDYGLSRAVAPGDRRRDPGGRQRGPGGAVSRAERARRAGGPGGGAALLRDRIARGSGGLRTVAATRSLILLDRDGVLNAPGRQPGRAAPGQPAAHVAGGGVRLGARRAARPDAGRVRPGDRQQPARVGQGQDDARRAAGGARGRRARGDRRRAASS